MRQPADGAQDHPEITAARINATAALRVGLIVALAGVMAACVGGLFGVNGLKIEVHFGNDPSLRVEWPGGDRDVPPPQTPKTTPSPRPELYLLPDGRPALVDPEKGEYQILVTPQPAPVGTAAKGL